MELSCSCGNLSIVEEEVFVLCFERNKSSVLLISRIYNIQMTNVYTISAMDNNNDYKCLIVI